MDFLIVAEDREGAESIRDELRPVRLKWLESNLSRLVAAGGMVDDRNRHVHGGLMIVKAANRAEAEALAAEDPFAKAGLYRDLRVIRWRRVFFDHRRVTDPDPFRAD
jgi:uncharacterized protein YciI